MKILFLTTVLPRKKRMGSEVASQTIIDALGDLGARVTVIGYIRPKDDYCPGVQEFCAGRRHIETRGAGLQPVLWLTRSLVGGLPYSVAKHWSGTFVSQVKNVLREETFDLVMVDHVQMSWLLDTVPLSGRLIGIAHNVEHQMYQSFGGAPQGVLRRWIYARESRLLQQLESVFVNRMQQLWVLTRRDAEVFAALKGQGSIREIPLPGSVELVEAIAPAKAFDIGLVGSWTWKANAEGLRWFLERVYPRLAPEVAIHIAGHGAQWLAGRYRNVEYRGFVDDVQTFLRQARVVAIPTLSGGGIQIKTLDAIASGSRIVATPLALRGIDDCPPTVVVAETAETFAAQLGAAIESAEPRALTRCAMAWSRARRQRFHNEVMRGIRDLTQAL